MKEKHKQMLWCKFFSLSNQANFLKGKTKNEESWAGMGQRNNLVTGVVTDALSKISESSHHEFKNS